MSDHGEQIRIIEGKVSETEVSISEVKGKQQIMEDEAKSTSSHIEYLKARQLSTEEKVSKEVSVLQQQQTNTASRVSHSVQLLTQLSNEQKGLGVKITTLKETEKQLSEEIEKTGGVLRQLSVKEDEIEDQVKDLRDDVDVMRSDVIKVREEISTIQQKGKVAAH